MRDRFIFVMACAVCAGLFLATPAWGATVAVPVDQPTVQAAVDAAAAGDSVVVAPGTFVEHVTIGKPLTIVGAGAGITTIDGSGTGPVISITAPDVTVKELTVANGDSGDGIDVRGSLRTLLEGVEVRECLAGIRIRWSTDTVVRDCELHHNAHHALDNTDTGSARTVVEGCDVHDNTPPPWGGGALNAYAGSNGFTVRRTSVHDNAQAAVQIGWCSGWLVEDCLLEGNTDGLVLDTASGGTARRTESSGNSGAALALWGWGPQSNTFEGCILADSVDGAVFGSLARYNTMRDCIVAANATGVRIVDNPMYDNRSNTFVGSTFFANARNAQVPPVPNTWDAGYPAGGNFWSDYVGVDEMSGTGQDVAGADGIGDSPYGLESYNVDHYPRFVLATTVDVTPDTFSRKRHGRFVTAFVQLPPWCEYDGLTPVGVTLNGVPAVSDTRYDFVSDESIYLTDSNGDGITERMFKFPSDAVAPTLTNGSCSMRVTGPVPGGIFDATDTIRVIK